MYTIERKASLKGQAPPDRREIFAATAKPSLRILSWAGTYTATSGSPHTGAKKSRDVCETAAIYSLSLLARFLSLSPRIVEVSHSISESWHQLAIRMSFVGRLRRVGRDRFHSCFLFTHTSESACMGLVVSDFPMAFTEKLIELVKIYPILYNLSHEHYKNVRKKDKAWEQIGVQLKESGKWVCFIH